MIVTALMSTGVSGHSLPPPRERAVTGVRRLAIFGVASLV
jgi:hypothetical protein